MKTLIFSPSPNSLGEVPEERMRYLCLRNAPIQDHQQLAQNHNSEMNQIMQSYGATDDQWSIEMRHLIVVWRN